MTSREPEGAPTRPNHVTQALAAESALTFGSGRTRAPHPRARQEAAGDDGVAPDTSSQAANRQDTASRLLAAVPDLTADPAESAASEMVTQLYSEHYRSLVRLAALLVHDLGTAEEVVQDSFVAMHTGWRRLRDNDKALAYLRQSVVNKSRSVLRHRGVVEKYVPKPSPDEPSAEYSALSRLDRSTLIAALRALPERQREVVVLRYYADLTEAQIADAMRISRGAVKSHCSRAMAALRAVLERET